MFDATNKAGLGILGMGVGVVVLVAASANAQCFDWEPGPMTGAYQGITAGSLPVIEATTAWDHDGNSFTDAWLVVAGDFDAAGGVPAKNIAAWDGHRWHALGTGLTNAPNNAVVRALAVSGGELVAGGSFTIAGGAPALYLARWNGFTWQSYPTFPAAPVAAILGFNGSIIVAGTSLDHGQAGNSNDDHNVRRYDSDTGNWTYLGTGINGNVDAIAVYNGELYAGGTFTMMGPANTFRIARWNGSSWQSIGGIDGSIVRTLMTNTVDNTLFVGGQFNSAGGVVSPNAITWNGASWVAMGAGLGDPTTNFVFSAAATSDPNRRIVVAGTRTVGTENRHMAASWNGTSWTVRDKFNEFAVVALAFEADATSPFEEVFIGGRFTAYDGEPLNRIAQWHAPDTFLPLYHAPPVRAMVPALGGIVAGGDFVHPATGGEAHYIAKFVGGQVLPVEESPVIPLGEGTNGPVHALRATFGGPPVFSNQLYVGGEFTAAGGDLVNRIARFQSSGTTGLTSWNPMGQGFNNTVYAIEVHGGQVYAGGAFTQSGGTSVNFVARWDGTNWQPVGNGLFGLVLALRSYNGELYAGGLFLFTGTGAAVSHIARWNGTSWNTVASPGGTAGMNGNVFALAVDNGTLVAGGDFTQASSIPAQGVARWNGSTWSAIGAGLDGIVNSLAVGNGRLVAGGTFHIHPSTADRRIAHFTGANWTQPDLDSEPTDRVYALAFLGTDLHAGGEFQSFSDGADRVPSPTWAIDIECEPNGPDTDGNGSVDVLDLVAVLTVWGSCSGCPEDINDDGLVDIDDLLIVLTEWGPVG